jgi:hypothetical protein
MNWEKRIRKLELHYYGDVNGTRTWAEFLSIYKAMHPEKFQEAAKHEFGLQGITPERSAVTDSPFPAETWGTPTCSSPVLTGTTPDQSTPATCPHNGQLIGVVRRAGSAGGKAGSQASRKDSRPKTARKTAPSWRGRKP